MSTSSSALATARPALRADAARVALAAFATTFAQHQAVGRLPTLALLKDGFHLGQADVAMLLFWASAAWYLKPLAGVLTDAVPLLGTRRRAWLVLGATCAGLLWVVMGAGAGDLAVFVPAIVAMNVALVFPSTVLGALVVEGGRAHRAPGRLTSARQAAQGVAGVLAPVVGGCLAGQAYGWTAGIAATALFALAAVGARLPEDGGIPRSRPLRADVVALLRSRTLLAAGGMLLFVHLAPGLATALLFAQRDRWHFSNAFLGALGGLEGAAALCAAGAYAAACRRLALRDTLAVTLVLTGVTTVGFVAYDPSTAAPLHAVAAFAGVLAELALFDLAVRATPAGHEALGYAVMMSARNLATGVSDVVGTGLMETWHLDFATLVAMNAGTTFLAVLAVPWLPAPLVRTRDGGS